jgi:hypothetical protein
MIYAPHTFGIHAQGRQNVRGSLPHSAVSVPSSFNADLRAVNGYG